MQLDSIGQVVKYVCPNRKEKENNLTETPSGRSQKPTTTSKPDADLLNEVSEIKARLLVILDRMTTLEKELQKRK